jgi:septal ring factor EnvC (AmiA/AmiB activator)
LYAILERVIMSEFIVAVTTAPFRALDGLISYLLFPPKPLTPEEQLLKKVERQKGQIRMQQDEKNALISSNRELDSDKQDLKEQLAKREAELQRAQKKVQDLERRLYQAWDRYQRKR